MGQNLPKKDKEEADNPEEEYAPYQTARRTDHKEGSMYFHCRLFCKVKIVGKQPQDRTGSGTDPFSEKGENQEQYDIIQADMQKNSKA